MYSFIGDAETDTIKNCLSSLNESCVPFEQEKAQLLAQNLEIDLGDCQTYKDVCLKCLEVMGSDKCTLGQVVCAFFRSGLARLCCELRPICKSV